jgi:hypothetical protein
MGENSPNLVTLLAYLHFALSKQKLTSVFSSVFPLVSNLTGGVCRHRSSARRVAAQQHSVKAAVFVFLTDGANFKGRNELKKFSNKVERERTDFLKSVFCVFAE